MVHPYPQADLRIDLRKLALQVVLDLFPGHLAVEGDVDIEQHLDAVRLVNHAEIVVEEIGSEIVQKFGQFLTKRCSFRILRVDGIDVDDGLNVEFLLKRVLQLIGEHVRGGERHIRGNLHVERHHPGAGAVVMNDEVMHAQNVVGPANGVGDFPDELRVRLLPEERAAGLHEGLHAGDQDECGNGKAAPAVDGKTGEVLQDQGEQDHGGGDAVVPGIAGSRVQSDTVKAFREPAVVVIHIELDEHRENQDRKNDGAEGGKRRVQNFIQRLSCQLKAHDQNHDGDEKTGQIFDPPVPEGMTGICLVAGQTKADQGDNAAAGIGEVVQGIGDDGNRAGEKTCQNFDEKQEQVEENTKAAGQSAVAPAHIRVLDVVRVRNKFMNKKANHRKPPEFSSKILDINGQGSFGPWPQDDFICEWICKQSLRAETCRHPFSAISNFLRKSSISTARGPSDPGRRQVSIVNTSASG